MNNSLLFLTLGLTLNTSAIYAQKTTLDKRKATQPNILFILTDDHASAAISAYGSKINQTPNIDRLANEGMRFDNVFCTNSICAPSRAVILSGRYSHLNGVTMWQGFNGTQPTLQGQLKKAGYYTALVGKWHLDNVPTHFDHWQVFNGQGEYFDPKFRTKKEGNNSCSVEAEDGSQKLSDANSRQFSIKGYATDIVTDESFKVLDARPKDSPFLLLLWHKAPHRNWLPPKKYEEWLKDEKLYEPETLYDDYNSRDFAKDAEMRMTDLRWKIDLKQDPEKLPSFASKKEEISYRYQLYIKDYLRCIRSVDDNVGRTLDYLDKNGLADNTIVIYAADQGFYLGENSWFDKRWMYDISCKMPFIVRYPAAIKPNSVNKDLIMNLDFAPTLLDFAQAPIDSDMQGASFKTMLKGEKAPQNWRKATYYRYYDPNEHRVEPHYGCRTDSYKILRFPRKMDYIELFDLTKDPQELKNIANDPAYADIKTDMLTQLEQLRKQYKDEN